MVDIDLKDIDLEYFKHKYNRVDVIKYLCYKLRYFALFGEKVSLKAFSILDNIESYNVNVDGLRDELKEKILEKVAENIGFDDASVLEYIDEIIYMCQDILGDDESYRSHSSVYDLDNALNKLKELLEDVDGTYDTYNDYILKIDPHKLFKIYGYN